MATQKLSGYATILRRQSSALPSCSGKIAHILWLLICCLLGCFLSAAGHAEIRESSDKIVDVATERTLERMAELQFALPQSLATDHDVYLLIAAGGAVYDVRLLARPSVSPKHLAYALHEALSKIQDTPLLVEWSQDDDFSAARYRHSQAHWGQMASTTSLALGKLVAGIRQAGYTPHVLVRIPRYTVASSLPLPAHRNQNNLWFLADNASPDSVLTVQDQLSTLDAALPLFLLFGTGIFGTLGIVAAVVVARILSLPLETRRWWFFRIALAPPGVTLAISTAIGFFYMSSTPAARVADLWLGSTMRSSSAEFVLLNPPVFMVLAFAALFLKLRLFPEKTKEEIAVAAVANTEERAIRKRISRYLLIPGIGGLVALAAKDYFIPRKNVQYQLVSIVALSLCSFGGMFVQWLFRGQLKALENETTDAELTRRVERVGQELQMPIRLVKIRQSESARNFIQVEATPDGRVAVSRKAWEQLSSAEMDFAIASALVEASKIKQQFLYILPVAIPGPLLITFLVTNHHLGPKIKLPLVFALFIGMFGMVALLGRQMARRYEYNTARRALQVTSDLEAALSLMRKQSEQGVVAGSDTASREKAYARRAALLQRITDETKIEGM